LASTRGLPYNVAVTIYEDLKAKRVLVTGASGGLGAGIARAFGRNGARVIVHFRTRRAGAERTVSVIEKSGGEAVMLRADLRNEQAIDRLVARAVEQWRGLDILVNNAGIVLKASILDADAALWDDSLKVNLRAPYLLSRSVAKHMIDTENAGCILNNSSIHARSSAHFFGVYAASKAGLEAFSRVMALEWAPHNIRVNCIAPGVVPVERTREALEKTKDVWMPYLPAARFGLPADIAELSVFLCSDKASWITGQSFTIDGGLTARMNMPQRPQPPLPPRPDPIEEE